MTPTMAYRCWEQIIILVHTDQPSRDDEWKIYCGDVVRWRDGVRGVLVVSEGGGPNAGQRARLKTAFTGVIGDFRTAVVTRSRIARKIVAVLSWFTSTIKPLDTVPAALRYLAVPEARHEAVLTVIRGLRQELGLPPL